MRGEKDRGGLGIKMMRTMNLALMAKLGWRVLIGRNNLWEEVLISKYMKGEAGLYKLLEKKGASNVWREIVSAASILNKGTCKRVGNGGHTLFWGEN